MNSQSNHLELCPSLESLEQQESQARIDEFYNAITEPEHVGVSIIAPLVKVSYDLRAPLAIREDSNEFGVTQVLFGILRAGNHGFGIVQAYGNKLPESGFRYLSRLCQEPHGSSRALYTAHLREDKPVVIGGRDTVTADLQREGYSIELTTRPNGEVWAKQLEWSRKNDVSFRLLTAVGTASKEDRRDDLLTREDRTWAVEPGFIQRKAARTMTHKKRSSKRSVSKPKEKPEPKPEAPQQQVTVAAAKKQRKQRPSRAFFKRQAQQHIFESIEAGI